jgi:RNA polymerase sigma factor (sigma-70 family)
MSDLDEYAAQAREGDRAALEALAAGLQDRLYRLALRMLGDPESARDATQEILVLVVTQLSTFRGESSVSTWAYRVATRYLLKQRKLARRYTFEAFAEENLGLPPNQIEPSTLAQADARLLEREVYLGCAQAMLQALEPADRITFVLGSICQLEGREAAFVLEISEPAFRKRLSRVRATFDAFLHKHCGVANPAAKCRCEYQVNVNVARGRLRLAELTKRSRLPVLNALHDIGRMRDSVDLYRTQPEPSLAPEFAERLRQTIATVGLFRSQ